MKRILLLIVPVLLLTGCVTVSEESNNTTEEEKPLTKQVCDWFGWNSGSIIEEQAEQGYIYTGRSRSFLCEDMLNFQLKED